ncbi:uncharacterized protein EI97DRAFT_454210 [Westerdykella ornata]|uniref:Uncharacterized protein n=1 Tax=Westerdykella ornata TaxID=318751 RepID=A0A6A6JXN8_WESOR|nr:uncharacterized protein EI97DRAFT_454210 [Westerdykella ornata]KAF2280985.1 hypothetical protein EI97DRAFT_454210 [Westerdykella ornata]
MVLYCTVTCGNRSMPLHRNECRILYQQTISRIGDTFSKAITTFRQRIFELNITHTVKSAENMTVYVDQTNLLESGTILFDFPRQRFSDPKDTLGILCANWSGEALGYFHGLLNAMLKGD